jgi:hypothetical protein
MSKPNKTKDNPHGLTQKQRLTIADMIGKVKKGVPLTPSASVEKFYNVGSKEMAQVIASRNMKNPDFRTALMEGLEAKQILGRDSRVESGLDQGLEATDKDGNVDYATRLKYIQEINKIAGVYAPERKETKTLRLNVDVSEEELDEKIKKLQRELE